MLNIYIYIAVPVPHFLQDFLTSYPYSYPVQVPYPYPCNIVVMFMFGWVMGIYGGGYCWNGGHHLGGGGGGGGEEFE